MVDSLIVRAGGKLVTLKDDLAFFKSLAKFAGKREKLEEELNALLSPKALLSKIENLADDDEFSEVLDKLGLLDEAKKIAKEIGEIRENFDDEIDALETLLTPVGSFHRDIAAAYGLRVADPNDAEINWNIVSADGGLSGNKKIAFGLDLSGDLELAIDAAATWPFSDALRQPLLSFGVSAEAAADANGSVAFSPFFAESKIDAEAGVDVEFFYHVDTPKSLVALELVNRLKQIPNFLDYEDLWKAFADPKLGLEGIKYGYDSELDFELKVGIGKKFAFTEQIDVEAGLAVNVGVRRPSKLELTFMAGESAADGGRTIKVMLSRDESKERLYGVSAGLTLDLTKLAPRVHKLLKDALGKWKKGLDTIKPFLSPGTYIKELVEAELSDFVSEIISDEELSKALTADLRLILGFDAEDETKVAGWLVDQLGSELDKVGAGKFLDADNFEKFVEDAAKLATKNIAARLPRIGGTDLTAKLEEKIVALTTAEAAKLHGRFTEMVKTLFDQQGEKLGKELRQLGEKSKKAIKSTDDALAGVRKLIDRYDALFKKVVKATEDSAWAKISAAIFVEEERVGRKAMQFSGTFLANDENAKEVFDALLYGKIQSAATLLSDDNPSFDLNADESSITRFTKSSSKLGYELVLFGFSMAGTKLISGEAELTVGGDGSITVESKGVAEVEKDGWGESRSAKFTTANSILLARVLADQPPELDRNVDLGFSFTHKDRRLARKELEGLVQSLIDVDLLNSADIGRAIAVFNQWGGKGRGAEIRATVDIRLGLGREGMLALLGLDDKSKEHTLSASERERIAVAYRAMRAKYDQAGRKESHIETYREMITDMRRIYLSRPAGLVPVGGVQRWSEDDYEEAEKRIARLAKKRIKHLNKAIFSSDRFGSRLDTEFLIFIAVLKHLSTNLAEADAAAADNWHTNVIITHRPKKGDREVFVLI